MAASPSAVLSLFCFVPCLKCMEILRVISPLAWLMCLISNSIWHPFSQSNSLSSGTSRHSNVVLVHEKILRHPSLKPVIRPRLRLRICKQCRPEPVVEISRGFLDPNNIPCAAVVLVLVIIVVAVVVMVFVDVGVFVVVCCRCLKNSGYFLQPFPTQIKLSASKREAPGLMSWMQSSGTL